MAFARRWMWIFSGCGKVAALRAKHAENNNVSPQATSAASARRGAEANDERGAAADLIGRGRSSAAATAANSASSPGFKRKRQEQLKETAEEKIVEANLIISDADEYDTLENAKAKSIVIDLQELSKELKSENMNLESSKVAAKIQDVSTILHAISLIASISPGKRSKAATSFISNFSFALFA